MITEAMKHLQALDKTDIKTINGLPYFMHSQGVSRIKNPDFNTIHATTLSGLVDYLREDIDIVESVHQPFIHIESPTSVKVLSSGNAPDRQTFIHSIPLVPSITFGRFIPAEEFNILLQAAFVPSVDRDKILLCVGNIREENVRTLADDGVTQEVTIKSGIARSENAIVPNPVSLRPFRTFTEIEQVESKFVFRIKDGGLCALFEADGGAWRIDAMQAIKEFLFERNTNLAIIS